MQSYLTDLWNLQQKEPPARGETTCLTILTVAVGSQEAKIPSPNNSNGKVKQAENLKANNLFENES